MNNLLHLAQNYVLIKDYNQILDFNLIRTEFDKLSFRENINNKVSHEMNFFNKDVFIDAKFKLEQECKNFLNIAYGMGNFYEDLVITNSWGNITEPGQSHHDHKHPFSVVSGVLFLDNDPNNLNLFIEALAPQIPYFWHKDKTYIGLKHLVPDSGFDPESLNNLQNHLVLFLSSSSHFVEATSATSPVRRSLSFNTFWKGRVGAPHQTLGSHIF